MRGLRRTVALAVISATLGAGTAWADTGFEVQSLDGSGNNKLHPEWGQAGTSYLRVTGANYQDGSGKPVTGPNARYISNRIFNDTGMRTLSERRVSQWAQAWAQFMDHTFGLRKDSSEAQHIPFDTADPLETFRNDFGIVLMSRSAAEPGVTPRQQPNLLSSYVDAFAVYGGTPERLAWLRDGAKMLLPDGLLPRRDARGNPDAAPGMDDPVGLNGRAAVTGDHRANENVPLLAVQTLFAREHNRIVDRLPKAMPDEEKFQIARKVVIATQQWITYHEFLPAMGVRLAPYRGYDASVHASLGNEFATVGYRPHSMVRGDLKVTGSYTDAELEALKAKGATVIRKGDRAEIGVPPNLVLFNPDLVTELKLGPLLQGLGTQAQSRNDEQMDNVLRSIQLKQPGCQENCPTIVFDISAIDVERGRDHGMPTYNQLRKAYGLAAKSSFTAVTGEAIEEFPKDPELTPGDEINDPDSLDFVGPGVRRTSTAARLKAIYRDVSTMDAFVGMGAEPKVRGTEFGELQLAIWKRQFEALRDGDRFFHLNDPALHMIKQRYGIDYRRNLGDLIALNTDVRRGELAYNVFRAP